MKPWYKNFDPKIYKGSLIRRAVDIFIPEVIRKGIEVGTDIWQTPKGEVRGWIRDTDGTERPCWGGNAIPNVFLNRFKDFYLGTESLWSNGKAGTMVLGDHFVASMPDGLGYAHSYCNIRIGTSNTPAVSSQTGLQAYVKTGSTYATGNSCGINSSNGNITYTIKNSFATETGSASYNEAALYMTTGNDYSNQAAAGLGYINRIVFPSPINLTTGQTLILSWTITLQSLAVNPQPCIIQIQGSNINAQVKLIGATSSILGGTLSAGGTMGVNANALASPFKPTPTGTGGTTALTCWNMCLGTQSSFLAYNTDSGSNLYSNPGTSQWSAYVTGSYTRTATSAWAPGNPASNTSFQSIFLGGNNGTSSMVNGYQILLGSSQTKLTTAGLRVNVVFSI